MASCEVIVPGGLGRPFLIFWMALTLFAAGLASLRFRRRRRAARECRIAALARLRLAALCPFLTGGFGDAVLLDPGRHGPAPGSKGRSTGSTAAGTVCSDMFLTTRNGLAWCLSVPVLFSWARSGVVGVPLKPMPSSVIRNFQYRQDKEALEITFVSGKRYRYLHVPQHIYKGMQSSFSKGEYFNRHIRERFAFERIVTSSTA